MNHCSLSWLTHPSPTGSWEAFGSVKLSDGRFIVTVNCTGVLLLDLLWFKIMPAFTLAYVHTMFLLCMIMWIFLYACLQTLRRHTVYSQSTCTLYPTMQYAQQCDRWTASDVTVFNISFLTYFWSYSQKTFAEPLKCDKSGFTVCKTFLELLHLSCNDSLHEFWILILYNMQNSIFIDSCSDSGVLH